MTSRFSGGLLIAAAGLFWMAWVLMPGVGVTDPREIFELVADCRRQVVISVVAQLLSAVLYVPALTGLVAHRELGGRAAVRRAAVLLTLGAMGSAADAVLHLLAYAMTAPGLDSVPFVPVMTFMQGPGLALLMPLVFCFFLGGARLSYALADANVLPRYGVRLHWLALAVAIGGGVAASHALVLPRIVGLAVLGLVTTAQIHAGISLVQKRA